LYRSLKKGKAFKVHEDDKVLKEYGLELIRLLTYLDRSCKTNTLLQLPLNEEQKTMVHELSQRLKDKQKDLLLIHRLWYSFTAPPDDSKPIGKWQDLVLCFLAISHARADSSLQPVTRATEDCSVWEYLIRSGALYEISLHDESYGEMERYGEYVE
jgi:hypothetical protein